MTLPPDRDPAFDAGVSVAVADLPPMAAHGGACSRGAAGARAVSAAGRWSVVVVARNAARLLPTCLASVPAEVPVLVLDHCSWDATAAVAQRGGARVVRARGPLGALRLRGLAEVRSEWALFLDADEHLRPGAATQVSAAVEAADASRDGMLVGFATWLGGRRLRAGGWGRTSHLRLVRVARAHCAPEVRVHERLTVAGGVGVLGVLVDHHTFTDLGHARRKHLRYAVQGARARVSKSPSWLARRGALGAWLEAAVRCGWRWLRRVVVQAAWRDGVAGLRLAGVDAGAVWIKHRRVARLRARRADRARVGR